VDSPVEFLPLSFHLMFMFVCERWRGAMNGFDDLRYMPLAECAARENISFATLKREIKAGRGPKVTKLSPRRLGIRFDHYRLYAESRVLGSDAA
jgi:hypothetical protein